MNVIRVIREEIAASPRQRISFDRFMDLALYHPNYGYYTSGAVRIGSKNGDFFTSSSLGADFGELLAEQFVEMAAILGDWQPFTLVEVGAGSGILAKDILDYVRRQSGDFYKNLRYVIVEQSPSLIDRQRETLREYLDKDDKVCWRGWDDLGSIVGCVFSNELIDAFPVHQVTIESGELREVYVTLGEPFREIVDELSSDGIRRYFELVGVSIPSSLYPEGYRTEVNLEALRWLEKVSEKIDRGYVVTIDYGYPAEKYYHPQRYRGTLQCYCQHQRHDNPYLYVGQQDMTAHVDFTALERQGGQVGFKTLGFTRQGMLLMALGLGDRLVELSSGKADVMTIFQRRDALHQLIEPTGLGGFGVLVQGKGVPDRSLRGLRGEGK
jgi:SAM-dependent MidA family methyltransferase